MYWNYFNQLSLKGIAMSQEEDTSVTSEELIGKAEMTQMLDESNMTPIFMEAEQNLIPTILLLYKGEQFNPSFLNVFNIAVSPLMIRDESHNTVLSFDFYTGSMTFTTIMDNSSTDIHHLTDLVKDPNARFLSIDPVVFSSENYVVFSVLYSESQGTENAPNVIELKSRRSLFVLDLFKGIESLNKVVDTYDAKVTVEVKQEPSKVLKVTSSTGNKLVEINM